MSDNFNVIRNAIDRFSEERDWEQFHTPKNLSMALTVEASELLELFQWISDKSEYSQLAESKKQAIEHEIADVFIYLMRFCSVTGIDPLVAVEKKLVLNAEKYPVDKVKGKSAKYTEY